LEAFPGGKHCDTAGHQTEWSWHFLY
jgi:hypothetical protein